MIWRRVTKFDPRAALLADRHYSRRTVGSPQFMPPGRTIVLLLASGDAVWGTHWPKPELSMDGLDAWRCCIFRNESGRLSSELIREAMDATAAEWDARPRDGWVTFVRVDRVRSVNPGACFKSAGWKLDRDWMHRRMVRLRADVPPARELPLFGEMDHGRATALVDGLQTTDSRPNSVEAPGIEPGCTPRDH